MLEISVSADIKEASRYLRKVGERNIPLAVAQALTGTAKHLAKVQALSTTPTNPTAQARGRYRNRPGHNPAGLARRLRLTVRSAKRHDSRMLGFWREEITPPLPTRPD
jgi:hypothetical protein